MLKTKKAISFILSAAILISCFSIISGAIVIDLGNGEGQTISSDTLSAKQTQLTGKTYKTSGHGIYFTAMYLNSNDKYVDDISWLLNYNSSDASTGYTKKSEKSSAFTSARKWKLKLNPYRLYNDCRGTGTLTKAS